MNEAAQTLEGWYALHDFRTIDWSNWKALTEEAREEALQEIQTEFNRWKDTVSSKQGSTVMYRIVGQKADLLIMHLRETLEELDELETAWNKTTLGQFTLPTYSYVSVVELSNYLAKGDPNSDPMDNPYVAARLKPELPPAKHICFYPMNKRRQLDDNWYMLGMEERREMMRSHGMIGRKYAGKVKQIITGSVGLDDWEWGVTLFSDDALSFKKLVYEMRFDEVSARYGDFGAFYVGNRLDAEQFPDWLKI